MPIFFPRIDDSHCDRIHSSLTAVCCYDNGYVGKQPVAQKEYFAEYWSKELKESMDRPTGRRDITEILLNTIQQINQPLKLTRLWTFMQLWTTYIIRFLCTWVEVRVFLYRRNADYQFSPFDNVFKSFCLLSMGSMGR